MPLDFRKISALVVEDTQAMQKLINSVLETLEIGKVYNAKDGESGFQTFCETRCDIILADWVMDPMDGVELTKKVRTSDISPNPMVPIILVTGYNSFKRVAEARDAGVTEFLVKPFTANDLIKRMTHVVNKPRDFVDAPGYKGPDRRRRVAANFKGPYKREDDQTEAAR